MEKRRGCVKMLTQPFFMRKAQTFSSPGFVITAQFENLGELVKNTIFVAQFENLGELVKNTIFVA